MAGYGFWLNHITMQQDRLKTNTVESLNAVIASKDAEIGRLKGETAPEIAQSYKTMRDYAEEMAKKTNSLEENLGKLRAEVGEKDGLLSVNYLSGKTDGLLTATEMMVRVERSLAQNLETADLLDVFRAFSEATGELLTVSKSTNDQARVLVRQRGSNP